MWEILFSIQRVTVWTWENHLPLVRTLSFFWWMHPEQNLRFLYARFKNGTYYVMESGVHCCMQTKTKLWIFLCEPGMDKCGIQTNYHTYPFKHTFKEFRSLHFRFSPCTFYLHLYKGIFCGNPFELPWHMLLWRKSERKKHKTSHKHY